MAMDVNEFVSTLWTWFADFAAEFPANYLFPNLQLIIQIGLLVIVGYILGKLGKAITVKLLSIAGLRKVTIRSWTDDILRAVGYRGNIVSLIGDMVKWFIYIMFIGIIIIAFITKNVYLLILPFPLAAISMFIFIKINLKSK